jgi:hypothetical protein
MFVAAHDLNGRQRWAARPGSFASPHGFCASPIPENVPLRLISKKCLGHSFLPRCIPGVYPAHTRCNGHPSHCLLSGHTDTPESRSHY